MVQKNRTATKPVPSREARGKRKEKKRKKTRLTDRYVCRLWRKTKEDDEVCSEREREEEAESSDNAHLHSGYATGGTASVFEISLPASVRPPFLTSLSFFLFFFCFLLFSPFLGFLVLFIYF